MRCQGLIQDGSRQCKAKAKEGGGGFCAKHQDQRGDLEQADACSDRERRFVNLYFKNNMSGTAAYQELSPDCTYESAKTGASRMMARERVRARVERRINNSVMPAEEVLMRLSRQARADLRPFLNKYGQVELDNPNAQENLDQLAELDYSNPVKPKLKLKDQFKALRELAKYHDLTNKSTVEMRGKVDHAHSMDYDFSVLTDNEFDEFRRILKKLESTVNDD